MNEFDNGEQIQDIPATLSFMPNAKEDATSLFIARWQPTKPEDRQIDSQGIIVFPDPALSALIKQEGLVGQAVRVLLIRKRSTQDGGGDTMIAAPNFNHQGGVIIHHRQPIKPDAIILIDGPNFLNAIKNIDHNFSPLEVIIKIADQYCTQKIRFYVNWPMLENDSDDCVITPEQIAEIKKCSEIEIIKVDSNTRGADTPISVDGTALLFSNPLIQTWVLFSGDKDFSPLVNIWLGNNEYSQGARWVDIYSSAKTLGRPLSDVICQSNGFAQINFFDVMLK